MKTHFTAAQVADMCKSVHGSNLGESTTFSIESVGFVYDPNGHPVWQVNWCKNTYSRDGKRIIHEYVTSTIYVEMKSGDTYHLWPLIFDEQEFESNQADEVLPPEDDGNEYSGEYQYRLGGSAGVE